MVFSSGVSDSLQYAMSLQIYRVWGGILCYIPKLYWIGDILEGKAMLGLATKGTLESNVFLQKLFLLLQGISVPWEDFHSYRDHHLYDLYCSHAHRYSFFL